MLAIKPKRTFTRRKIIIGTLLASGAALGAGFIWYLTEGEDAALLKVLRLPAKGRQVVWSPDGKRLAVVMIYEPLILGKKERAVQLWDLAGGKEDAALPRSVLKGMWIGDVAFSPDGKTIGATVTEGPRRIGDSFFIDTVVKLFDSQTLALKQTVETGDRPQAHGLAFSPDGKLLATADPGRKTIDLRNANTGLLDRTLNTEETQPWCLVFSLDGKTLVTGGQIGSGHQNGQPAGQIQVWNTRSWTLEHVLKQPEYVNTVAISADGKLLASGGGDAVQIWDAQTGELVRSLQGLSSGTRSVAISPDGKTVAAGARDGKIRLWEIPTGRLKATLKGPGWGWLGMSEIYSVAFSPDGQTLASAANDHRVCLWRIPPDVAAK